jgi:putative two-component system response regulator
VLIAVANALERRRLLLTSRLYERELEAKIYERTKEIRLREEEITLHLVAASEFRDEDTGSHIRRIGQYAAAVARALGWDESDVEILRLAAPMHDVGKIGIPDHILLKKGKLTDDEFDVMRRHTQIGAAILAHSVIPLLSMGKTIALQHHERWDGTGYPHGHTAADTEECARIVAIADVYDALVTDRVYRPAFSETEALSIMRSSNGTHFDPRLFECFMDTYPDIRRIRFEFPDDTPRQRMLMGN